MLRSSCPKNGDLTEAKKIDEEVGKKQEELGKAQADLERSPALPEAYSLVERESENRVEPAQWIDSGDCTRCIGGSKAERSPEVVAPVEFREWTADGHLRHPTFGGIRDDKKPDSVVREAVT